MEITRILQEMAEKWERILGTEIEYEDVYLKKYLETCTCMIYNLSYGTQG